MVAGYGRRASEGEVTGGDRGVEPMYVRYAREFHVSEQLCENENKSLRRINRFIVYYFGAYLCNVDLEASRWHEAPDPASPGDYTQQKSSEPMAANNPERDLGSGATRQRLGGLQQSRWKRQLRFNWIPQVILASYCVCLLYLLVVAYYQYCYDFDVLRLHELKRRQADSNGKVAAQGVATAKQLAKVIKSRIVATKVTLDWLGPVYSHMTILAGCFYMCIATLAVLMHLPIYLHHRYQRPFDQCHIVRDLLDQKRENELSERMVGSKEYEFLESSRVYHANMTAHPGAPLGTWQAGAKLAVYSVTKLAKKANLGPTYSRNGGNIPGMVREMHSSGALVPLYKLRSWICKRTLVQFGHHACLGGYTIAFHVALNWSFYWLANYERPQSHQSTYALIQLACLGPLMVTVPTITLHPPITMMVVREQIQYIGELRNMIAECVTQNSKLAKQIRVSRNRSGRQVTGSGQVTSNEFENKLERTMNSNLVFVLLHYKIFVAQLMPMLFTLGVLFVVALAVLFAVPIIVRLHIPYLRQLYEDKLTDTQIRIFAIVISASAIVPINMLTMPICHMFAQCERLYRNLNSLTAHVVWVRTLAGCARLYDNHAHSCLLKELSDSSRFLGQLTARAGPISGTYKNLVKALFWYGLLLTSILADNTYLTTGNRFLLSSLMSDPLGVYAEIRNQTMT